MTTFVLLPGLDGTGELFEPFVRARPDGAITEIVSYPPTEASVATLVQRVVDALPQRRPFVLVAESFSGPVALAVAERRPPGLRAVVLCATFVTCPAPWTPACLAPLVRAPLFSAAPSIATEAALLGMHATPELRGRLRAALRRVPASVLAARTRATMRTDAAEALRRCEVPVLILTASQDLLVPPSRGRAMQALRPDATLRKLTGPHLLLQTAPSRCWDEISAFLAAAT